MPGGGGDTAAQALAIQMKGFHPALTAARAAADTPPPTLADRETMGADLGPPVPPTPPQKSKLLSVFLVAMKRAGKADSFEARQARMAIELFAAGRERRVLAGAGKLRIPDLQESHKIPPADEAKVDELYEKTARWIIGGLQDHLRGLSYRKLPVAPETLRLARETKLVP